jgi:ankyrin repeat protein
MAVSRRLELLNDCEYPSARHSRAIDPRKKKNNEMVTLLKAHGADQSQALVIAAFQPKDEDLDLLKSLLDRGASVNTRKRPLGMTALMFACMWGKTAWVKLLLENGADIDLQVGGSGRVDGLDVCFPARSLREAVAALGRRKSHLFDYKKTFWRKRRISP